MYELSIVALNKSPRDALYNNVVACAAAVSIKTICTAIPFIDRIVTMKTNHQCNVCTHRKRICYLLPAAVEAENKLKTEVK